MAGFANEAIIYIPLIKYILPKWVVQCRIRPLLFLNIRGKEEQKFKTLAFAAIRP